MNPSPSAAPSARAAEPDSARWFVDEVQRHEPQLRSYLVGRFPRVRDVDDVVQESFLRIWRARTARPIQSAKAFLFTIARHLALDAVRRDRFVVEEAVGDLAALNVIEDKPHAADAINYHEKVWLLADVLAELPERCREVVVLRKLRCLSQREVAEQLGLSERTVENQLARGMKRCEAGFRKRGITSLFS